jgi:hypothetical protein
VYIHNHAVGTDNTTEPYMTDKGKEKAGTGGHKGRALSVLEKLMICKKRQEPKHRKESLAVFGAHFPDEKGEPLKPLHPLKLC